eukprot:scaffold305408_cov33-Prasinocladus_malaysianus.AAC.1
MSPGQTADTFVISPRVLQWNSVASTVLSNGEVVVAYNAHGKSDGYPEGARALLFLATSSTRGRTWTDFAHLEMDMAKGTIHSPLSCPYPSG